MALASCSASGRPPATPISAPGNDAKPPSPSTTSGRRLLIARSAATQARTSANGPTTSVARPLPRMPRNGTASNSTPCCGTSVASIPPRVPSQNTRAPRAASFAATARPGKTWPPVPPAVIITVALIFLPASGFAACGSLDEPLQHAAVLVVDPQQQRERDAVGDDSATAEREQRQRQPFGRQHTHVDAHVDERLHAEPDADSLRAERRERALETRREPADRPGAVEKPDEERDHGEHADEAELLGDHREEEIGVRFGKVEKLLDARSQADSEPLAAPEGDQRMRELVAAVHRVRPRIEEHRE